MRRNEAGRERGEGRMDGWWEGGGSQGRGGNDHL